MTLMHTKAAIATLILAGVLASAGPAAANGRGDVTTVSCGQTVTQNVKLINDLIDCPNNGLVVGAAGITVDLTYISE